MRWVCLLPILLLACEEEKITLPSAQTASAARADHAKQALTISLTADGRVLCKGKSVNLDQLGGVIKAHAREYDRQQRAKGAAFSLESRLPILIRAATEAPWLHVYWLRVICAEEKTRRTSFAVKFGDGKLGVLKAHVPSHLANLGLDGDQRTVIQVAVMIVPREEKPGKFAGADVTKPSIFQYRRNNQVVSELAQARKWIDDGVKLAKKEGFPVSGVIRAGNKTPYKLVIGLFDQMRAAGIQEIEFHRLGIPKREVRVQARLPYPKGNWR